MLENGPQITDPADTAPIQGVNLDSQRAGVRYDSRLVGMISGLAGASIVGIALSVLPLTKDRLNTEPPNITTFEEAFLVQATLSTLVEARSSHDPKRFISATNFQDCQRTTENYGVRNMPFDQTVPTDKRFISLMALNYNCLEKIIPPADKDKLRIPVNAALERARFQQDQ